MRALLSSMVLCAAGLCALPAQSQEASSSRMELFGTQGALLDGKLSDRYANAKTTLPASVQRETVPRYKGAANAYTGMARKIARKHGIPEDLFLRLVRTESNWNPNARSHKGAIGLAQLMPSTARELGVNAYDPKANLEGGARYLAKQYRRFGSWRLALAAYNAGPGAVRRYGDVPPFAETQGYVRKIMGS